MLALKDATETLADDPDAGFRTGVGVGVGLTGAGVGVGVGFTGTGVGVGVGFTGAGVGVGVGFAGAGVGVGFTATGVGVGVATGGVTTAADVDQTLLPELFNICK